MTTEPTLTARAARVALSIPLAALVPATRVAGFAIVHLSALVEVGVRAVHKDFRKKTS